MNPLLKDAVAMLRQHGLAAHIENGSHIRVRFTNSFGTHEKPRPVAAPIAEGNR